MSTDHLSFYVAGRPVPEGSTKAYLVAGKPRITHQGGDNLKAWRQRIATEAQRVRPDDWQDGGDMAYSIHIRFVLDRPASIPRWKRIYPTVKPDLDKTARAVLDALTGILWIDDCRVIRLSVSKDYPNSTPGAALGAHIEVHQYANVAPKPAKVRA